MGERRQRLPEEVEDDGVHHAVRQRVLLVEQRPQEHAVRSRVRHLGHLQDGRRRVEHRHRAARQHARHDDRFTQRARARLRNTRATCMHVYCVNHYETEISKCVCVRYPLTSQSGNKMPLKNAAGLKKAFFRA